jgi:hypothetical protein
MMHIGRFLRTIRLLAMLGLAGSVAGCGTVANPTATEKADQIRESKKAAHQQAGTDLKKPQGSARKAARRGPA